MSSSEISTTDKALCAPTPLCSLENRVLLFLHVPKAAGSTLDAILSRQFSSGVLHFFQADPLKRQAVIETVASLPDARQQELRFISGHLAFGIHRFLTKEAVYLSMLRHPLERIVSNFYSINLRRDDPFRRHVRQRLEQMEQRSPAQEQALAWLYSAPEYLRLDNYLDQMQAFGTNNLQTRGIGGFVRPLDYWPPYPELPADALSIAIRHMHERFATIGITERFDESIVEMGLTFGWTRLTYKRRNITRNRPQLTEIAPAIRARIERENELDIELYEHAQRLFQNRLEQKGDRFAHAMRIFQRQQQLYTNLRQVYHRLGLAHVRRLFNRK